MPIRYQRCSGGHGDGQQHIQQLIDHCLQDPFTTLRPSLSAARWMLARQMPNAAGGWCRCVFTGVFNNCLCFTCRFAVASSHSQPLDIPQSTTSWDPALSSCVSATALPQHCRSPFSRLCCCPLVQTCVLLNIATVVYGLALMVYGALLRTQMRQRFGIEGESQRYPVSCSGKQRGALALVQVACWHMRSRNGIACHSL